MSEKLRRCWGSASLRFGSGLKSKEGRLPKPIRLGKKTTRWRLRSVLDVIRRAEEEGM
jgi:hypothetical protein